MQPEKLLKRKMDHLSPEAYAQMIKDRKRSAEKSRRDYLKSLSPEDLEAYHSNKKADKEARKKAIHDKRVLKRTKLLVKREIAILEYMLDSGIYHYHHGRRDSLEEAVQKRITRLKGSLKENPSYKEYHNYIWNYNSDRSSYMYYSLLHCLWRSSIFKRIHQVPLDGTYVFYTYDAGERGGGSFNRISVHKADEPPYVPNVNPGGFPPITSY